MYRVRVLDTANECNILLNSGHSYENNAKIVYNKEVDKHYLLRTEDIIINIDWLNGYGDWQTIESFYF